MPDYPGRLHHKTPGWVKDGAVFHLRIRAVAGHVPALTDKAVAPGLLAAARRYHELGNWWCTLFLVMPDHLHALIAFPASPGMSETVRNWKRSTARFQGVRWQDGYFDHRLRDGESLGEAWGYISRNPVVKGLCATADRWPWWWSGTVPNPPLEGGAR